MDLDFIACFDLSRSSKIGQKWPFIFLKWLYYRRQFLSIFFRDLQLLILQNHHEQTELGVGAGGVCLLFTMQPVNAQPN